MKKLLLGLLIGTGIFAQSPCSQTGTLTASSSSGTVFNNQTIGCSYWRLTYYTNASAISISIQGAIGSGASYSNMLIVGGSSPNPDTTIGSDTILVKGYYPLIEVTVTTLTAGSVWYTLQGQNGPNSASISVSPLQNTGPITIPNATVLLLHTTSFTVILAQGAGTLIAIDSCNLENVYLTSAYTGGGTISLFYGTGTGTLAAFTPSQSFLSNSSTGAPATFLTGPTANQMIGYLGISNTSVGGNLSSTVLNQAVVLSVGTANFATGAGSLIIECLYSVYTGF